MCFVDYASVIFSCTQLFWPFLLNINVEASASFFQVFYYSFAIIGMEVFAHKFEYFGNRTYDQSGSLPRDKWYCDSKDNILNGTDFYALHYCRFVSDSSFILGAVGYVNC